MKKLLVCQCYSIVSTSLLFGIVFLKQNRENAFQSIVIFIAFSALSAWFTVGSPGILSSIAAAIGLLFTRIVLGNPLFLIPIALCIPALALGIVEFSTESDLERRKILALVSAESIIIFLGIILIAR